MIVTHRLKRGSSAMWASKNPVLDPGEPGFETDTRKVKIGNGATHWNDLPYSTIPPDGEEEGPDLVLIYENGKV